MEQALIEYVANSVWQLPLLAGGAWLLLRIAKPEPPAQHWVWVAVLAAAAMLPLRGMERSHAAALPVQAQPVVALMSNPTARMPAVPAPKNAARQRGERWTGLTAEVRSLHLNATAMQWLMWIYMAAILLGGLRLIWAWRAARRLVEHSREMLLSGRVLEMFERHGRRLGIELPILRDSGEVLSPVVVGIWKPVLLLPEDFLVHTEEEIEAALCHELAHVRRRDTLANLLCQAAALPLVWHPAMYAVQRRIRSTREMICDAMAAEGMRSEIGYAKCLAALARSMVGGYGPGQMEGLGLFDNNTLEERIMRLTKAKMVKSARVRIARAVCGAAVMMAVTAVAAMFHVSPTLAEAQAARPAPSVTQSKAAARKGELGIPGLTAIGHGKGASVIAGKGEYVHRWTGSDGKPFVIANHQRQEPTREERRRIEKEFARRMAKMARDQMSQITNELEGLNLPELQQQVKNATAQVDTPEFKKQMADMQRQIQSGELQRSAQMAAMNAQLTALNSADIQRQVKDATAALNSPEFKKQMAQIQKQIQSGELQRSAQMAAMQARLQALNIADMQRQMKEAAAAMDSRQLKQQMAEVQKAVQNGTLQREKAIQILKDAETQLEATRSK